MELPGNGERTWRIPLQAMGPGAYLLRIQGAGHELALPFTIPAE